MITRNGKTVLLGNWARPVCKALPPSVSRLSRQCGILNISQPYRPPWLVTGMALLSTHWNISYIIAVFEEDCKVPSYGLVSHLELAIPHPVHCNLNHLKQQTKIELKEIGFPNLVLFLHRRRCGCSELHCLLRLTPTELIRFTGESKVKV
jgi:hypothetical protein